MKPGRHSPGPIQNGDPGKNLGGLPKKSLSLSRCEGDAYLGTKI